MAFLFVKEQYPSGKQAAAAVTNPARPVKGNHDTILPAGRDSLRRAESLSGTGDNTYTGMLPFFEALDALMTDKTSIHIAYFGDSMIEGDFVTHPLRRRLQKRFGGNGIGFVPVTTPQPGFRRTILQEFSNDWNVWSFVKPAGSAEFFPGLSGYVFGTKMGAEVRFRSEPGYGPFRNASILYGGKNVIRLTVITDSAENTLSLAPGDLVSSAILEQDSLFSTVDIRVVSPEPGVIYGLNFEGGRGIYVDNYAFRGNSGLPLKQIPPAIYSGFHKSLNNKLIIIHYGLNVFTPGVEDYHWYEQAMYNVVRYVQSSSPGIPVLIISMPDRAALISGEYATPAELPDFIQLQRRVAEKTGAAFFNLFDAMGGVNSMRNWVEGPTKLAGDDYTHPNGSGAALIAGYIYTYLMNGYDQYLHRPDSATMNVGQFRDGREMKAQMNHP